MKNEVLSRFPHIDWSLFGFLIFVTAFVGVLFWVFRQGSSDHYSQISKFPFGEDQK